MRFRPRSIYDLLAALAFFGVLAGGTAYAANEWTGTNIVDESLTGADIKGSVSPVVDGTLTGADIKDGSIDNPDIVSQGINGGKLQQGSVGAVQLRADGVNSAKVLNDSLTSADIKNGTLTGDDLGPGAVDRPQIQFDAVGGEEIEDGTLTAADIESEPWHLVADNPASFSDPCPSTTGVFCGRFVGSPFFWQNYGAGLETARYYKDALGHVHIEGLVKSAGLAPNAIFMLPAGYRPAARLTFAVDCASGSTPSDTFGRLDVAVDGTVSWEDVDGCEAYEYISLSGVDFRAEG